MRAGGYDVRSDAPSRRNVCLLCLVVIRSLGIVPNSCFGGHRVYRFRRDADIVSALAITLHRDEPWQTRRRESMKKDGILLTHLGMVNALGQNVEIVWPRILA